MWYIIQHTAYNTSYYIVYTSHNYHILSENRKLNPRYILLMSQNPCYVEISLYDRFDWHIITKLLSCLVSPRSVWLGEFNANQALRTHHDNNQSLSCISSLWKLNELQKVKSNVGGQSWDWYWLGSIKQTRISNSHHKFSFQYDRKCSWTHCYDHWIFKI